MVVEQIDSSPEMPSKIRLDQWLKSEVEEEKKEKSVEGRKGKDVIRYSWIVTRQVGMLFLFSTE